MVFVFFLNIWLITIMLIYMLDSDNFLVSVQKKYQAFFTKKNFKHSYHTEKHWSDIKCLKINYIFF